MLLATTAAWAFSTTNPGKYHPPVTDTDVLGIGADSNHFTKYLVPQHQTRATDFEPLVVAQIKLTVMQMDIGVANATGKHFHQYFRSLWNRCA
jgi:hypothetical protein